MISKSKLERFKKVIIIGEHKAIERDVEIKARKGQPGITKEDVRQLARLGYKATIEDGLRRKAISGSQTVVKRIRQWKMGLGSAFLIRRPADKYSPRLRATNAPSKPQKAQSAEISLDKGSKKDPNSIINQLTSGQAKKRLIRLYDKYGIPRWIGIHPKVNEKRVGNGK